MEIWFNSDKNKVRLPVLPSEIIINGGTIETSMNTLGTGEVSLYGGNKLQEGEISCFFPARKHANNYSFLQYKDTADPYYFISIFRHWLNNGQAVQFIITPNILSFPVRIISFEYGEKDGSGDIYYTLKWKEVKKINVKKLSNNVSNNNANENKERPPSQTDEKKSSNNQKTHIVGKGDSLWKLAQKHYGNGSLYPKIVEKNKTKYPSLVKNPSYIRDGWVLVIP